MPVVDTSRGRKPPGHQTRYTKKQLKEFLRCANDPVYFIESYCWIVHPTRGRIRFYLYDFQKDLIRTYVEYPHVISMLSRQVGKTITAAVFLLWWAIFKPDQTILIASNKGDNAKDIMERLKFSYEELPWWIKPGVESWNVMSVDFDNHSKVEAQTTTATTGRGRAISLFYLDEFAYVPPNIANPFWVSLFPTLSTGGRCIITSTPNTDEDKFAMIWLNMVPAKLSDQWEDKLNPRAKHESKREESYETIFETEEVEKEYQMKSNEIITDDETLKGFVGYHAHWERMPWGKTFRDEKFKRQMLLSGLTENEWLREFECSFISGEATLISPIKLLAMSRQIRHPRFVDRWGCRWFEEIRPNTAYAVVLDPSEGVDRDDACVQVWEIPALRQVAEWNDNKVDQVEQTKMLRRVLMTVYEMQQDDPEHDGHVNIYYSVERNGLGIGILNVIEIEGEEKFPGYLLDSTATSINIRGNSTGDEHQNRYRGLITTITSKKRYCIEFKNLVERNLFTPRSKRLVSQAKSFVKRGNSYGAKAGAKDDIFMRCVLMCHLIDEVRFHEPDLDDLIRPDITDSEVEADTAQAMVPIIGFSS